MRKKYFIFFILATSALGYSQCSILKNFNTSYYAYSEVKILNDKMIFKHKDNVSGEELWSSDGTPEGTLLIKDIYPGVTGSSLKMIGLLNNNYYFFANDGVNGLELWKTNGTSAGTVLVKNIVSGASGVYSVESCNGKIIGNELFFTATVPTTNQWNLWKTDGTDAGTVQLSNFSSNFSAGIGFETLGSKMFFNYNNKLYVTDGTSIGTTQFGDFNLSSGGTANVFIKFKDHLYFFVPTSPFQLWKTDGTLAGTSKVTDISLGYPAMFEADSNSFYFNTGLGRELWTSDGTAANTKKLKSFSYYISNMELVNGILYFSAYENNLSGLWRSDGTLNGTYLIKNIPYFSGNVQGNEGYDANKFYRYSSTLLFTANGSLWTSDGTNSGTVSACTISDNATDTMTIYNNNLYFFSPFYLHKYNTTSLSLNQYDSELSDLNIFPNPVKNILSIKTDSVPIQKIELYDLKGRLILSETGKEDTYVMDISQLENATYILIMHTNKGIQKAKLVKD